jgi:hypothetical protein
LATDGSVVVVEREKNTPVEAGERPKVLEKALSAHKPRQIPAAIDPRRSAGRSFSPESINTHENIIIYAE